MDGDWARKWKIREDMCVSLFKGKARFMQDTRIVQLVSLPVGWRGVYRSSEGEIYEVPISAMALVEYATEEGEFNQMIRQVQHSDMGFDLDSDYWTSRRILGPGETLTDEMRKEVAEEGK